MTSFNTLKEADQHTGLASQTCNFPHWPSSGLNIHGLRACRLFFSRLPVTVVTVLSVCLCSLVPSGGTPMWVQPGVVSTRVQTPCFATVAHLFSHVTSPTHLRWLKIVPNQARVISHTTRTEHRAKRSNTPNLHLLTDLSTSGSATTTTSNQEEYETEDALHEPLSESKRQQVLVSPHTSTTNKHARTHYHVNRAHFTNSWVESLERLIASEACRSLSWLSRCRHPSA